MWGGGGSDGVSKVILIPWLPTSGLLVSSVANPWSQQGCGGWGAPGSAGRAPCGPGHLWSQSAFSLSASCLTSRMLGCEPVGGSSDSCLMGPGDRGLHSGRGLSECGAASLRGSFARTFSLILLDGGYFTCRVLCLLSSTLGWNDGHIVSLTLSLPVQGVQRQLLVLQ